MVSTLAAISLIALVLAQQAPLEALEPSEPIPATVLPAMPEMRPMEPMEPTASPATPSQPAMPISLPGTPPTHGSVFQPGMGVLVAATSLGFRSGPGTEAPMIYYILQGEPLRVLNDSQPPVEEILAGKPGWWVLVEYRGRQGYVFDAYLEADGAVAAVEAPPMPPTPESGTLTCIPGQSVGPITHYSAYADLAAAFGVENLSQGEVDFGGGVSERVTRVYAGTDKELLIRWEIHHERPLSVRVLGTAWQTPKGIGVGTPAAALEQLNGRYFAFYGFGWEFAGQVTSWDGGALESDHALRDRISLALGPKQPFEQADFDLLEGKIEFTSDHPMAPKVNLCVESMTITLNP